jgi:hypothetical protein
MFLERGEVRWCQVAQNGPCNSYRHYVLGLFVGRGFVVQRGNKSNGMFLPPTEVRLEIADGGYPHGLYAMPRRDVALCCSGFREVYPYLMRAGHDGMSNGSLLAGMQKYSNLHYAALDRAPDRGSKSKILRVKVARNDF